MKTRFYWKLSLTCAESDLLDLAMGNMDLFDERRFVSYSNLAREEYPLQTDEVKKILDELFIIEKKINQLLKLKAFW